MTMTNNGTPRDRAKFTPFLAVAIVAMAAIVPPAGCSPKKDNSQTDSGAPRNVTLTADQLRHIRLYTVAPSKFHKPIEASGAVAFVNGLTPTAIAPMSGPDS